MAAWAAMWMQELQKQKKLEFELFQYCLVQTSKGHMDYEMKGPLCL